MPDLLSHVLVGYTVGKLLALRFEWFDRRWVTVVMFGALAPDVDKLSLLIDDSTMQRLLGQPFTWETLQIGRAHV